MIERLRNKVIVSVQAMPNEPLYREDALFAMMQSVINGGASALRVAGKRDVINAKRLNVPVIGLTKPNKLPDNWLDVVYITPTVEDAKDLITAGADVIAFDGTMRERPNGDTLESIIKEIKDNNRLSMADISTFDEASNCISLDVDIISTTLSGYTRESLSDNDKPDFELLKRIVDITDKPVILEGRIWTPSEVDRAFELGAHSVVIGSAITRPQLITKRFIER